MVFGVDRRVLVLALARMADAIANSFLIIVLPLYIASGGVSLEGLEGGQVAGFLITEELLIGVVLSLFGFLNSFAQPFTGRLSDRTGRRRVYILFGLALLAVASGAYAVVESYLAIVLIRAFQGIGAAFTIPCTIALVNELARSDAERGGNFGVFNTFRLVGFGFGPIVAGLVVDYGPYTLPWGRVLGGFDAAFAVAVVGALVSFSLVALLVSDTEGTNASASEDLALAVFDHDGNRLFDPVFVLGVGTLFMAVGIALFATLQTPINARLGQDPQLFGIQFAAVVMANVALQVPVGRACDRYGRRPFLLAGFVVLVPAVFLQGVVTSPWTMLGARLIHGVAVALVFAPALAVAGDLAGEGQSGTTLSVLTMAFGLGTALGPLLSGFLVSFGFVVPFALGAVLGILAFSLTYTQVPETLDTAGASGEPQVAPQD